MQNLLGIYEKALPNECSLREKLQYTGELGFNFMEISIDETDERLGRLYWPETNRWKLLEDIKETGVPIQSMCFSGQRKYPMGSRNALTRNKSMELIDRAIDFAAALGIRLIQLAGYDVYYEEGGPDTHKMFLDNLKIAVGMAARQQVMLSVEIMDTAYLNSITKYLYFDRQIQSPWLTVYPDLGNLTAWGNNVTEELQKGIHRITGVHVKETLAVTASSPGKFKEVPFGAGCVDFVNSFRTLKSLGYTGPFMIEMWTGKEKNALNEVRNAKKFILNQLAQAGYLS
jgi:L-ribulose-5-phosphate 3-epimerase